MTRRSGIWKDNQVSYIRVSRCDAALILTTKMVSQYPGLQRCFSSFVFASDIMCP
jgi:hypothetical protein